MVRPSFFLVCSVKLPERRRRLVIPVPLLVLDDLLQTGLFVWQLVCRFRPQLSAALDGHLPQVRAALQAVPQLMRTLRTAGPFTMVEVADPGEGVEVTVRLI